MLSICKALGSALSTKTLRVVKGDPDAGVQAGWGDPRRKKALDSGCQPLAGSASALSPTTSAPQSQTGSFPCK